jgi:hypothetical protein
MPHKFCYHQWITVWIGRNTVSDVCLLCRKRVIIAQRNAIGSAEGATSIVADA